MLRISGNENSMSGDRALVNELESNHGYVNWPTSVSLNDANRMRVPSSELHIASGVVNISSANSLAQMGKSVLMNMLSVLNVSGGRHIKF